MGSIMIDGYLVSIGEKFFCPKCGVLKKTIEFLTRVKGETFAKSDIICNDCFDKQNSSVLRCAYPARI